jgi:hypothetical protein
MEYINWVRDEQGGRGEGRWFYLISFREGYIYIYSIAFRNVGKDERRSCGVYTGCLRDRLE